MILEGVVLFLFSFLVLWVVFGAFRLHALNEELEEDIKRCTAKMDEALHEISQTQTPQSIEDAGKLNAMKIQYAEHFYLSNLEQTLIEEDNNIFWSLIDVYARQRVICWGYWALSYSADSVGEWYGMGSKIVPLLSSYNTETPGWHESFLFSEEFQDISQGIEEKIEKRRDNTQCQPEPHPPEGIANRRAYTNVEPLRELLTEVCADFEKEEDYLLKIYESEGAYFLSVFVKGFSSMRWWEQPIYGWFTKKWIITYRYIWLDISCITGISFFAASVVVWWRQKMAVM